VIVFSDYDHGTVTKDVAETLVRIAVEMDKPVVVDSKSKEFWKFRGATIALPNNVEAQAMTGMHSASPELIAEHMVSEMKLKALGLTLGPGGILLSTPGGHKTFPTTNSAEVIDVAGAGDTVTAAVAIALSVGLDYEQAMVLANLAAGVVVQKWGVATTTVLEICQMAALHGIEF